MKDDGVLEDRTLNAVLLGEFMFGSHWGHKMGKNRNFYIFDCIEMNGIDLTDMTLDSRLTFATEMYHRLTGELKFLRRLKTYKTEEWKYLWDNISKSMDMKVSSSRIAQVNTMIRTLGRG